MSNSSSIISSSGLGRPPISLEYKGYTDNVQQHPDLNRNQTMPDSFPLQNVSKLECKAKLKINVDNPLSTKHSLVFLDLMELIFFPILKNTINLQFFLKNITRENISVSASYVGWRL
jgi:hypothetical protein